MTPEYANRFFGTEIAAVDPLIDTLIKLEEERQRRRIILIPSESYAPQPVREALGSVFTNIYAEGYPPSQMVVNDEELLADLVQQLAYYRRYADRRFYKGADYVHFVETLAQRRAAACFANPRAKEEEIFVNVQPLSGAVANLAVYDALMEPGDTLMGMDLFQGGHLTHGSEFNISGRRYHVVSYGVSSKDTRLDYDEIRKLAEEHRPRVIVAGYTSYPWAPDFERFREIADRVGAYLMADIAHPAGMAIAGVYPNPVGVADVVTFTTHKTLCGPRGACILTTNADLAQAIDMAVFPGMQGGPHTNKFAAMCVAFEIARSEAFKDLQRRTVANAQALARELTDRGLELAYGGTDTHLLLIDLKSVTHSNGQPLYGEPVARILELAGIIVNKNTIPWDEVTALATGIRMGTPWVTQRGMGAEEMDQLAEGIARIVHGIAPFYYEGLRGRLPRGKIDLRTLEEVKWMVDDMTCAAQAEIACERSTYPHYCLTPRQVTVPTPIFAADAPYQEKALTEGTALIDLSDQGIIRVSGWRAQPFLNDLCTVDIAALEIGQRTRSLILDQDARVLDDVTIWRLARDARERDQYLVMTNPENTDQVVSWMRGISDGYILFDDRDVWRKVQGPAKVEVLSDAKGNDRLVSIALHGPQARETLHGAIGESVPHDRAGQIPFAGHTLLIAPDDAPGAEAETRYVVVGPLAGIQALWDALAQAGATPIKTPEGRRTLRSSDGLPARWPAEQEGRDARPYLERLPHLLCMSKPYFVGQDRLPRPAGEGNKKTFAWVEPIDAPLKRTPLYEEHKEMGCKLVPFAGWEMPVWYTSVGEEHRAVRETAGLFDVAHMGTLKVSGPYAADFLDLVSTNYVRWLRDGESQYAGLLDADGHILDDIVIYRQAWDRFLVVVNAANSDKDWAWLNAVNDSQVIVDRERPWVGVPHPATLRNLQDASSGPDQRVDIALQGPSALQILLACVDSAGAEDAALRAGLNRLRRTQFIEGTLNGIHLIIARTGYTGEEMGFELYVHPDQAVALWRMLLAHGADYGIKPCGLAARDSTRIEAGLPLYGHELAGPSDIAQTEAGFAGYVKYHKPFFAGRTPYKADNDRSTRRIVRFQVTDRGARALRGGEHGEPVVNKRGRVIGTVTSCTFIGDHQIGMALVDERYTAPETELSIYPETRKAVCKAPHEFELGDTIALPINAVVLTRFPQNKRTG